MEINWTDFTIELDKPITMRSGNKRKKITSVSVRGPRLEILDKETTVKEGMPPANQVVIIAHKGKKIGSFEVRHGAKVHHIDQELRKLSKDITLGNFERTSVARDLAHGKIARSGDFAFQIQAARPKELE